MSAAPPKTLDEVLKDIPKFKVRNRPPQTVSERDDPDVIYNPRSLSELSKEALRRAALKKVKK